MLVPSIHELGVLFDSEPVSVAEVSLGQFLPLELWPEGELKVEAAVAGRQARVYLNPSQHRVKVEIYAPDLVLSLTLGDVSSVVADLKPHGVKTMAMEIGGQTPVAHLTLRLRPDISLGFDNCR